MEKNVAEEQRPGDRTWGTENPAFLDAVPIWEMSRPVPWLVVNSKVPEMVGCFTPVGIGHDLS